MLTSAAAPVSVLTEARDLLRAGRFTELAALVDTRQHAAAESPAKANILDWTLHAFRLDDGVLQAQIEAWAKSQPNSWVPLFPAAFSMS